MIYRIKVETTLLGTDTQTYIYVEADNPQMAQAILRDSADWPEPVPDYQVPKNYPAEEAVTCS